MTYKERKNIFLKAKKLVNLYLNINFIFLNVYDEMNFVLLSIHVNNENNYIDEKVFITLATRFEYFFIFIFRDWREHTFRNIKKKCFYYLFFALNENKKNYKVLSEKMKRGEISEGEYK